MSTPFLEVEDLVIRFPAPRRRQVEVISGVSFTLGAGETLSLVGESGSGKTTIGRAILGLAPVSSGTIRYLGQDIVGLDPAARRELASELQVVFQDPYSSLNPALTVGSILAEPLAASGRKVAGSRIRDLLDSVGLPSDAEHRFPREFSGGQRQRIAIARALALKPSLIVCDEPTSALDVTTQATVLNLLDGIQQETGVSYLFISHDLGVVHRISDRIAVLRSGQLVEIGDAHQVSTAPSHPYTRALQMAAPLADPRRQRLRREKRRSELRSASPSV